jgi:hypothetical protein
VVKKSIKHDIVKVSSKKTQLECLIRWEGYTDEHDTWEIMDSLHNCPEIAAKYKRITNYEKFLSGTFFWTTMTARCRENNVVATTPFFGGLTI